MQRILFCVSVVYTFTRCILSSHRNTLKLLIILTDPFGKEEKKEDRLLKHPTELLNGVRLHEFLLCVDTKVEQKHGLTTVGHCNKLN